MTAICKEKQGTIIKNSRKNPVCSIVKGAYILATKLTGTNADKFCVSMADIMGRYFAGCPRLIEEVKTNAKSNAPINVLAREAQAAAEEHTGDKRRVPGIDDEDCFTPEQVKKLEGFFNAMRAHDHQEFKKQRRLTLGDDRRAAAKMVKDAELEKKIQENITIMHERKNKSDVEKEQVISQEAIAKEKAISLEAIAKEKAISQEIITREQAITKEVIAKEEATAKTLQLRIELAKLTQMQTAPEKPVEYEEERTIISTQVLPAVTGITIEDVATKQNLITGTDQEVYSVLSQIGRMVQKPPYSLIPLDTQRAVMYPNGQVHAVNQYCPGDENEIAGAIKAYLYMHMNQTKQARPATNNHSINKYFSKTN